MLRVVEAFSGIGAQKQALLNAGIKHEIINTIEWDINAIYAYDKMHNGDKEPSKYSKLEILDTNKAYLTIHEGKFHQVKRMFEKANCTVTYLQRIEFGPLKLNDLPLGEFRALTQEELDALKS